MSGAREAEELLAAMAPALDAKTGYGLAAIPRFIGPLVEAHNAIVRIGAGTGCLHVRDRDPQQEQVLHIAVWRPGQTCCTDCATRGWLHTGIDARQDHTCDRCNKHRPGQVSASVARLGRTLVWFGVCTPCAEVCVETAAGGAS